MEMLAEMEGDDEKLKGLNEAEHKPEDDMQTDEWMYELKQRKSLADRMEQIDGGDEKFIAIIKKLSDDQCRQAAAALSVVQSLGFSTVPNTATLAASAKQAVKGGS